MKSRGDNARGAILSERAAAGVQTWKLLALTAVIVILAVVGGLAWNTLKPQDSSAGLDLGLQVGAARSLTLDARGVS